jgi:hypothetical protein
MGGVLGLQLDPVGAVIQRKRLTQHAVEVLQHEPLSHGVRNELLPQAAHGGQERLRGPVMCGLTQTAQADLVGPTVRRIRRPGDVVSLLQALEVRRDRRRGQPRPPSREASAIGETRLMPTVLTS